MMYTLEELERKNFAELKQIGDELNVLPEGDRRYRQTWIDAIVGVNSPLLQVLEVSPAEEVQAQEKQVLEVSPAEEVQAQEQQVLEVSPAEEVQAQEQQVLEVSPAEEVQAQEQQVLEVSPAEEVQEPMIETVEIFPAENQQSQEWVDTEPPNREDYEFREEYDEALKEWRTATNQEAPLESKFGRIVYPKPAEEPIAQAAKTSPGVEVEPVQDIINETWTSWEKEYCAWLANAKWCIYRGDNKRIEKFLPVSKTLRLEGMKEGAEYCTIWEVSECDYDFSGSPLPVSSSLYAQATKTSPGVEVDPVKVRNVDYLDCPCCQTVGSLYPVCPGLDGESLWETRCTHCDYVGYCVRHPFEDVRPFEVDRFQEPVTEAAKTSPGVEVDPV
ncbi:hypothetical protein QUB56_34775 [Microcoleus sp. AR_TQ3_B6]|uniref:hypothetical protein n=1 Tax=Microcoleus sp. AR_TQ3_B6 TaxID=3055284 RepID=UPI002FD1CCC0